MTSDGQFEVGDIVRWVKESDGKAYEPGPYVVEHIYREDEAHSGKVRVTHLNGSKLHFRYRDDPVGTFPNLHGDISPARLHFEPFLTAAHKAIHAQETKA